MPFDCRPRPAPITRDHDADLKRWIRRLAHGVDRQLAEDLEQEAWAMVIHRRASGLESSPSHDQAHARWAMFHWLRAQRSQARHDRLVASVEPDGPEDFYVTALDLDLARTQMRGGEWELMRCTLEGMTRPEIEKQRGLARSSVTRPYWNLVAKLRNLLGVESSADDVPPGAFHGEPCSKGHTLRKRRQGHGTYCVICTRERVKARIHAAKEIGAMGVVA